MKTYFLSLLFFFTLSLVKSQTVIPTAQAQINAAVMAAPADKRQQAMVYGYNENKEIVILRKGTNEMVCLADDPDSKGLNVACYHKDLDPFMSRGRELKKQGKGATEIFATREKEAKSGKLKMPKQPTTLFVFSASDENFKPETGEVKEGNLRYVVYIPYATSESTGLPISPEEPGMPWIMDPGTHGAHIMITPARQ